MELKTLNLINLAELKGTGIKLTSAFNLSYTKHHSNF